MRPTLPLLLITVLQGVAGGLALAAAFSLLFGHVLANGTLIWIIEAVALVLASAGGIASIFHMHKMSAGKYILRRLKTSWLSREALTTGLFGIGLGITVVGAFIFHVNSPFFVVMAWLDALLAVIAMYVTAMLYATIPAMRSWNTPLTVMGMMGIGIFSGWYVATFVTTMGSDVRLIMFDAAVLIGLTVMLMLVKTLQRRFFLTARENVLAQTGLGLPTGPYRLQDTGTSTPPYKTQTQIWPELEPSTQNNLYRMMFLILLWVPLIVEIVILRVPQNPSWGLLGAIVVVIGAFMERWLFFADATHSSRVWFSDQSKKASGVATDRKSPAFVEKFRQKHM